MSTYWAMKTFENWANYFIQNSEFGIDEDGVDSDYRSYQQNNCPISNPRIERRFKQFCKWANIGDYVAIGIGQTTTFNIKLIGRIVSEYQFDQHKTNAPRHFRKIEIMRVFDPPISVEKWGQVQRMELIDHNDFLDTLIYHL